MDQTFIAENIASTDANIAEHIEQIASEFERLGADLRSRLTGALDTGQTQKLVEALGAVPSMISQSTVNANIQPLATQLQMRMSLEVHGAHIAGEQAAAGSE